MDNNKTNNTPIRRTEVHSEKNGAQGEKKLPSFHYPTTPPKKK